MHFVFVKSMEFEELMVPEVGVEPTCPYGRQILSLVRLPFRHSGNSNFVSAVTITIYFVISSQLPQ